MAFKIIYRKRFNNKLFKLANYLETEWNRSVADDFVNMLLYKLSTLASQPNLGLRSEKMTDARSILVTKQNRLICKIKANNLIIIDLRDTRMNPKRNKY